MPPELAQTYFIFHVSSNYTDGTFYQSPIANGFAKLNGLKLNTSYKVDIAVGFPRSKLLWPVIQPIQSVTLSTKDMSEVYFLHDNGLCAAMLHGCIAACEKVFKFTTFCSQMKHIIKIVTLSHEMPIFTNIPDLKLYFNYENAETDIKNKQPHYYTQIDI